MSLTEPSGMPSPTNTSCLIGEGSVHTDAAFRTLQAMGYQGFVALEGDPIGPDEEASFRKNMETVTGYMNTYLA